MTTSRSNTQHASQVADTEALRRFINLKRPVFFYGWLLVVVTIVDGAFSAGTGVWGFSVFVQPMGQALGWSRAAIYAALTIRSLVSGGLAPLIGPLQDTRRGPRILAVVTTLTMSASLIAMRWVDDLVLFYLLFGVLGALASFGSSEMLMTAVLPKWFVRTRGRVLGIASTGTAMGPLIFPLLVTFLISLLGWRDAWLALGILTLAMLGPLSLLVRTRPEDLGLLPDGGPPKVDADALSSAAAFARRARVAPTERDYTRPEVIRLPAFWLLVLAFSLGTLGTGGFFSNWLPYFREIGFSSGQGSLAASAYGICSISIRAFWGWVTERYPVRFALALQGGLTALSVLLFLNISSQATLILAGGANGLAVGGFFVMRPLAVANYFGRGHLGSVNGIIRPFITLTSATSPLLVASLRDLTGSYVVPFAVIAACWLVSAFAVTFARPPQAPATAVTGAGTGS